MVSVDISNVWTSLSLPELLGREQEVFDAHNRLRDGEPEGPDHMTWLNMPEAAKARLVRRVQEVAAIICDESELLLVCGCGGAYYGAKAAVEAFGTAQKPEILFFGQSLSSEESSKLGERLKDRDYSLLIISHDGADVAVNVIVRSLRWMMERKYGDAAKSRIYVATLVGSPLHTMAQEEGYELFPLPKQLGGFDTVLTSGALLPMAVAGIDPGAVFHGAAESFAALDIRSFENPAWLYAAVRGTMADQGRCRELFCLAEPDLQALTQWLGRKNLRYGTALSLESLLLPGDLDTLDRLAAEHSGVFETVLRTSRKGKKVPIEMDWKDYDGLGFLYGKHLDEVEDALLRAMLETHNNAGLPIVEIDAGGRTGEALGALVQFFELSWALTAELMGRKPFAAAAPLARQTALQHLG